MRELEKLTYENQNRTHWLYQECYKLGVKFAIQEIEGWETLLEKAHKELPYSNPKEADREHGNKMRLLATIRSKLIARYEGKP